MSKDIEIPETYTTDLYVCLGVDDWNFGTIKVTDNEFWSGPDWVLLRKVEDVSFKLDPTVDVKSGVVADLIAEKEKVLAEAQVKANHIQDKIDNLLAITYEAAE